MPFRIFGPGAEIDVARQNIPPMVGGHAELYAGLEGYLGRHFVPRFIPVTGRADECGLGSMSRYRFADLGS